MPNADKIAADLKSFVATSYPSMRITVEPWKHDSSRLAISFVEPQFAQLYPYQRWHYLSHLIPEAYYNEFLSDSVWFELAPGEDPEELRYPDEELMDHITPDVMRCVKASGFLQALDDLMCPQSAEDPRAACWGDFRHSKPLLLRRGFTEEELFDVFHVLMRQGGFCDCEILFNVAEESRLKAEYWKSRADGLTPRDPHSGTSPQD